MTQLDFVPKYQGLDESTDGQYRIREYIPEGGTLQYRAFWVNDLRYEALLGAYDCRAAAFEKCCIHAGLAPIEMDQPQESQR